MIRRSSRKISFAAALCGLALLALGENVRPDLDAERLRTGSFHYRTVLDGKEAGRSRIQIRKADSGNFVFTNLVEGAFSQTWEAVATRAFEPISAKLTTGQGKDARAVFELAYRGGRVTGFASPGKGSQPERRPVDEPYAEDTVDQRIDWAAVMALKEYVPGGQFTFHVFDPGTGHSPVAARILGLETITAPAGSFQTVRIAYRIEKNRGTETYEVLVRKDVPRFLVKEQFPNGAVTELVRAEP